MIHELVLGKDKEYMNLATEQRILEALHNWENLQLYLNPKCSISTVSKEVGCNFKYLSHVINKKKGLDFPNYINQLRLSYLENYIRTVEEARNFKLTYLAVLAGFSSYGKFAKFIKDKTGYNPKQFMVFFDIKTA